MRSNSTVGQHDRLAGSSFGSENAPLAVDGTRQVILAPSLTTRGGYQTGPRSLSE
jgi:hypothetical protein